VRPLLRLALWVAVYLAILIAIPAAVPPSPNPTFYTPSWTAGSSWAYTSTPTYEGSQVQGARIVVNVTSIGTTANGLTATVDFSAPRGFSFPFTQVRVALSDGDWSGLEWTCAQGRSWANLTVPLPVGFSFPLTTSTTTNATESAVVQGDCTAGGSAVLTSEGGVQVSLGTAGSQGCFLYVCNQLRTYPFRDELALVPTAGGTALAAWTIRGTFDPAVSGYRYLSVSPGLTDGFENRSVNLTLGATVVPPEAAQPSGSVMYGESAALLIVWPVLITLLEYRAMVREARAMEDEQDEAVLAALSDEEKERAESDELLENETGPRPPG
jgi:hypothetical protein